MRIEMVNDRQIVDNLDMKTDTNSSNPGNVWPTNAELPQLTHDVKPCIFTLSSNLNLLYSRNVCQL